MYQVQGVAVQTKGRDRLKTVLRFAGGLISVADVSQALRVNRVDAAKILARWRDQGLLKRLRRGLYAPIPLDQSGNEAVEDAWLLAPELFGECYIGGWTAAEHWDLTEQIFRSTFVFTTKAVRKREVDVSGVQFVLKHVASRSVFGTRSVWRSGRKISVSDPHRTIVDILDDPAAGGGIRHVAACLDSYLKSEHSKPDQLIEYAERLGNGAVFKRLGFLASHNDAASKLAVACKERLTKGLAKLDPGLPNPRVVKEWMVRIPETWR